MTGFGFHTRLPDSGARRLPRVGLEQLLGEDALDGGAGDGGPLEDAADGRRVERVADACADLLKDAPLPDQSVEARAVLRDGKEREPH